MVTITFFAGQGCLASSISSLIDVFTIANLWHRALTKDNAPLFATQVVSVDGKPIRCDGGIQIHPHLSLDGFERTDFLLIPPFLPVNEPLTTDIETVLDWIIDQYRADIPIAAMCTGAFLLAETGLLDGKTATTNWQFATLFKRRYPAVRLKPEHILTEDSGLICTGAVTAIYHLALHIIERCGSKELASVCSKALLVDPNRNSQAPYIIHRGRTGHNDTDMLKAQRFMEENYSRGITMDDVAGYVCLSPRQFKRRFKRATGDGPLAYLQKVRIEAAKTRLETTLETIDDITRRIGYEDSSAFRRLFKKHTDLSPREYRDKFFQLKSAMLGN
jgi:transcriptional regulator GlxA family with amidase domain